MPVDDLERAARALLAAWDAETHARGSVAVTAAVERLRTALPAEPAPIGGFCPECYAAGRGRQGVLIWKDVRLARCQMHATAADRAAGRAEVERRQAAEKEGEKP